MSIDVHDSVIAGQHALRVGQRRALDTFEAARGVDLQVPAEAAKKVAKRTAKRAAKQATVAANRVAKRKAKRAAKHTLRRVAVFTIVVGALATIAVIVAQRIRETPQPLPSRAPEPFSAAELDGDQARPESARVSND